MKKLITKFLPVVDFLLVVFVYPAAILLKGVRRIGVHRLPLCKNALLNIGVFPVQDHYFEPQFNFRGVDLDSGRARNLPGINWNVSAQLGFLDRFTYANELANMAQSGTGALHFNFNNDAFDSGDAEYWYQIIRAIKPTRIIEIGSGHSTLMARKAIGKNKDEHADYMCEHFCVEPYEMPWLEKSGVSVIREKAEDLDLSFFTQLHENDILFIDSTHVIRPQGDVLFEYLELLPSLNDGVIVHVHDIFSPANYPADWLREKVQFWNEQYLLEAFLCDNISWDIIGALNYLHHNHYERLKAVAPYLQPDREPGSFYIRKRVSRSAG